MIIVVCLHKIICDYTISRKNTYSDVLKDLLTENCDDTYSFDGNWQFFEVCDNGSASVLKFRTE